MFYTELNSKKGYKMETKYKVKITTEFNPDFKCVVSVSEKDIEKKLAHSQQPTREQSIYAVQKSKAISKYPYKLKGQFVNYEITSI